MRYLISYIVTDGYGSPKNISSCVTDMADNQEEALKSFVNSYPITVDETLRVLSVVGVEFGTEKESWEIDSSFERYGYDADL